VKRYTIISAIAGALLALTGGVAVATTLLANQYVDAEGKYHGCVANDGVLRVVLPGTSCRKNETAIDWNQVGPQGPEGPQGPAYENFATKGPIGCCLIPVVTVAVPPGSYVAQAKGTAQNRHPTNATSVSCALRANGEIVDLTTVGLDPWENYPNGPTTSFGFEQSIANLSTVNLPEGGTISLACTDNGFGEFVVQDAHIVATAVGTATRTQS
jgi:hypothetical protein